MTDRLSAALATWRRALAAACALALACGAARALDRDLRLDQLQHVFYSVADGAPAQAANIGQTTDGTLWFAAAAGLYRFDGVRFELVPTRARGRLQGVRATTGLPDGSLAFGYLNGGVGILRDGKLTEYDDPAIFGTAGVSTIHPDADGILWVAMVDRLVRFDGNHWERLGSTWNAPEGPFLDLTIDAQGDVLASTPSALYSLPHGGHQFHKVQALNGPTGLFVSGDGRVWLYGADSFGPFDAVADPRRPVRQPNPRTGSITAIDRDGAVWAATPDGVERLARPQPLAFPLRTERFSLAKYDPERLSIKQAGAVLEDQQGDLWITAADGVHELRETAVVSTRFGDGGPPSTSLAPVGEGALWLCAFASQIAALPTDGLWRYRLDDGRLEHVQPGDITSATTALRTRDGSLWVAATNGLWHQQGDRFVRELGDPPLGQSSFAYDMAEGADGKPTWLAIAGKGLYGRDGDTWSKNGGIAALPAELVSTLTPDGDHKLWLGYRDGKVLLLEDGRVTPVPPEGSAETGYIRAIDVGRHVLVGTSSGLFAVRDGRLRALSARAGVSLEGVDGIVHLAGGDVWLRASAGLVHIAAADLAETVRDPAGKPLPVDVYGPDDGLPRGGSGYGFRAKLLAAPDGRLFTSGVGGLSWIDPQRLHADTTAPPVFVRSLTANDVTYEAAAPLRLEPGTRTLRLDYTALDYKNPKGLRFRYRLAGSDEAWTDAGARREAFYTNLGPGHYRFEVLAVNAHGVRATAPATLAIEIPPTFVQTRGFLALCVLAAASVLYLLMHLRVRRATARERELARERLGERERIARELHDSLLQSTQGLALAVAGALKRMPQEDPVRPLLQQAIETADQVMIEGRDRIQELRGTAIAATDLPQALGDFGHALSREGNVDFEVAVSGHGRELDWNIADEVYRIGREALHNAFRHARAKTIGLTIAWSGRELLLRVRDDGVGLDDGALRAGARPGHWGLPGMRERAATVGARVEIRSRSGRGTEVELRVPI